MAAATARATFDAGIVAWPLPCALPYRSKRSNLGTIPSCR